MDLFFSMFLRAPINAVANAAVADVVAAGAGADPQNGPPEAAVVPAVPVDGAVGAIGGDAAAPVVAPAEGPAAAVQPQAQQAPASAPLSTPPVAVADGKNTTLMAQLLASAPAKSSSSVPPGVSNISNTGLPGRFGVTQTASQRASAAGLDLPAFYAVVAEPEVAVLQDPVLGAEEVRRIETVKINSSTASRCPLTSMLVN